MTTSLTPARPTSPSTPPVSADPFAGLTETDLTRIAAAMTAAIADSTPIAAPVLDMT